MISRAQVQSWKRSGEVHQVSLKADMVQDFVKAWRTNREIADKYLGRVIGIYYIKGENKFQITGSNYMLTMDEVCTYFKDLTPESKVPEFTVSKAVATVEISGTVNTNNVEKFVDELYKALGMK